MAQSGKGLTARPAESEATWSGNQLLKRATKFAKTALTKEEDDFNIILSVC
ncbi:hypothetical protein [Fictibacillus arsenicus]|uniref:hypothetical protein n=1 Tax=Fictibacillus arsenicus TaxID=255247 RepID=UPI0015C527C8|nr:hypothetical protein [Fictibacillus arsenicus]